MYFLTEIIYYMHYKIIACSEMDNYDCTFKKNVCMTLTMSLKH